MGYTCQVERTGGRGLDITLDIDDEVVRKVSRIADDRGTTLSVMVEEYLAPVVEGDAAARQELIAKLEESVERHSRDMGPRTWTRVDLYDRPKRYYDSGRDMLTEEN